jgi:hypothetical protein
LFWRMLYSWAPVATTSFLTIGCVSTYQSMQFFYPITVVPACIGLYGAYQDLGQMVVGDVRQLLAVDLGNDELCAR